MRAIVKNVMLLHPNVPFEQYCPDDCEAFGFWLDFTAGPDDAEGGHNYRIFVCTPEWLRAKLSWKDSVLGRHMMIVFDFDANKIVSELKRHVEAVEGQDFWEMAQRISRIAEWEYEDYNT